MTTHRPPITPVSTCIEYIESCGWKLVRRGKIFGVGRSVYVFFNPNVAPSYHEMTFTLSELRDAYKNGW